MSPYAFFFHALKDTCALHCLLALRVLGPLPVSQRAVMDLTGFDDEAVRKGLNKLLTLGLAICTGADRRTNWQLAPAAHTLPLPLDILPPSPVKPESGLLKEEEELMISKQIESNDSSLQSSSAKGVLRDLAGDKVLRPHPGDKVLRSQFYTAFEAANVYLQFRRPLADALLADDRDRPVGQSAGDGPEPAATRPNTGAGAGDASWLRHALGWICYAQRRLPNVQRGAVVYISLRDRLPCDSAYLPPPELPFEAALAWALRGGEAEPAEPAEPDDESDQTVSAPETPTVSEDPADKLWSAVLEKLSHELPAAVLETQLRPARLVSLADDRCVLAAPSPQARDWLAARLVGVLERALRELTGREMIVEVRSEM